MIILKRYINLYYDYRKRLNRIKTILYLIQFFNKTINIKGSS